MGISPSVELNTEDVSEPLFSPEEEATIATVKRSRVWKLMRDALALERERLNRRIPDSTAPNLLYELGRKEGALAEINRLLQVGPHLVVFYDRYVRAERAKGSEPVAAPGAPPPPGEPPDV